MKKKILILSQFCDPEPTMKGVEFAKEIQKNDFDVEILTAFPNYPGGKIYKNYKLKIYSSEILENIKIHRTFIFPSHDKSSFKRSLNYISFFLSSFVFLVFKKKYDLIYVYHPPILVGLAAIISNFNSKSKIILDIQDFWPDTLKATGMIENNFFFNILKKISYFVYRKSNFLVVQSPGFIDKLNNLGIKRNIAVIYNWASENKLNSLKKSLNDNTKIKFIYAGNMGEAQDLKNFIYVFNKLKKNNISSISLYFIGEGTKKKYLQNLSIKLGLKNIYFLNQLSLSEVSKYINSCDLAIVSLKKNDLFKKTIPSKIQTYMYLGIPIIASLEGLAKDIIIKSEAGYIVDGDDEDKLYSQIHQIVKDNLNNKSKIQTMSINAKNYYMKFFSKKIGVMKFIKIFDSI